MDTKAGNQRCLTSERLTILKIQYSFRIDLFLFHSFDDGLIELWSKKTTAVIRFRFERSFINVARSSSAKDKQSTALYVESSVKWIFTFHTNETLVLREVEENEQKQESKHIKNDKLAVSGLSLLPLFCPKLEAAPMTVCPLLENQT